MVKRARNRSYAAAAGWPPAPGRSGWRRSRPTAAGAPGGLRRASRRPAPPPGSAGGRWPRSEPAAPWLRAGRCPAPPSGTAPRNTSAAHSKSGTSERAPRKRMTPWDSSPPAAACAGALMAVPARDQQPGGGRAASTAGKASTSTSRPFAVLMPGGGEDEGVPPGSPGPPGRRRAGPGRVPSRSGSRPRGMTSTRSRAIRSLAAIRSATCREIAWKRTTRRALTASSWAARSFQDEGRARPPARRRRRC